MKESVKQTKILDDKKCGAHFRNRIARSVIVCVLVSALLTGCDSAADGGYTREELNNLARIELYEAESGTLLKTIEDEETLYRYCREGAALEDAYASEAEDALKETAEAAGASYYVEFYQYPAAKFGSKTPKKIMTITLYRDTNIAKMVAESEVIKNMALPEELLTFYYEMSEEESTFYGSLLEEEGI